MQKLRMQVRMTTDRLAMLGYPIGSIYQCTSIQGRYLLKHSSAVCVDEQGVDTVCPWMERGSDDPPQDTIFNIGWTYGGNDSYLYREQSTAQYTFVELSRDTNNNLLVQGQEYDLSLTIANMTFLAGSGKKLTIRLGWDHPNNMIDITADGPVLIENYVMGSDFNFFRMIINDANGVATLDVNDVVLIPS